MSRVMRLLLAGLSVVICTLMAVGLFSTLFPKAPPSVISPVMVLIFFGLVIAAMATFNRVRPGKRYDSAIAASELEAQGLIIDQPFKATRSFQVDEFEDEGSHYFLELEGGKVLFLSGQYLYDYEPVMKGNEVVRPRVFPNSEFVIRRHKTKGFLVHLGYTGSVLEPEAVAPPFDADDFGTNRIPWDGQIITDKTFDQLRVERLKVGAR